MIRSLFIVLALALAGASAPALASSWIVEDSNLRSGPGTDYRVRAVLRSCARVEVLGRSRNWLEVDSQRGYGWVRASNVSDHRPRFCRGGAPIVHPPIIVDPNPWHPDPWHRPLRPRDPNPLDDWNRWHDW